MSEKSISKDHRAKYPEAVHPHNPRLKPEGEIAEGEDAVAEAQGYGSRPSGADFREETPQDYGSELNHIEKKKEGHQLQLQNIEELLQARWPKLTRRDIEEASQKTETLKDSLIRAYGYTKEESSLAYQEFLNDLKNTNKIH